MILKENAGASYVRWNWIRLKNNRKKTVTVCFQSGLYQRQQALVRLPFESKRIGQNGMITKISGLRLFWKIPLTTVNERQMRTGDIGH